MLTMTKEKVNTHFTFPMTLDMSGYTEKVLLGNKSPSTSPRKEGSPSKMVCSGN